MKIDILRGALFAILKAVPRTLLLALIVVCVGILLGAVVAVIRMKRVKVLSQILAVLMAYLRGTPLVVQLFIVYYSLPYLLAGAANAMFGLELKAFDISPMVTIYFTYILYSMGYQSENIRGALLSVEYGQTEACLAVGMTEMQAMRRIVFPQALAVAIPNFFSFYIGTVKQTSLAFMFQVVDILAAAKIYSAQVDRYTECYIAAALIYWALGIVLTFLFGKWEQHAKKGRVSRQNQTRGKKHGSLQT